MRLRCGTVLAERQLEVLHVHDTPTTAGHDGSEGILVDRHVHRPGETLNVLEM